MATRKYFLDNNEGGYFDTLTEAKQYVIDNYKPKDVKSGKVQFICGDDWPDGGHTTTTPITVSSNGRKIEFGRTTK